jgi:predicted dehydrogenase
MNRRYFLLGSALLAGTTTRVHSRLAANDTIRVGIAGLRGRGGDHIAAYSEQPRAEIAAVCDVDESLLGRRVRELESRGKPRPAAYVDFRKMLEDRSLDVVSIATPNHHHTLQTIWACQAGKDVYVEKPCSHTMFESRQIVAAARQYDRIVQHGSQSRSIPVFQNGIRLIQEGLLGDPYMARAICYKWRDPIGRASPEQPPSGVNYDLWTGPAPAKPFTKNRFHYNWHWQWDYGNGDIGNQGIHEIDIARWGLGVTLPVKVSAMGGHYMFDDDQETPNTMTAIYDFDDHGRKKTLVFELRHWISNGEAGIGDPIAGEPHRNAIGNMFYGCRGYMAMDGQDTSYKTWLGKDRKPGPAESQAGGALDNFAYKVRRRVGNAPPRGGDHFANFLDAARAHDRSKLTAEIEEGALSSMLVHLANISYRLGRTIDFDPVSMTCPDAEAQQLFTKTYREPFVVPTFV